MKQKQITLKQIGWIIKGTAYLNLWGGGQGSIEMERKVVPLGQLTRAKLLGAVNDNGFGCESIFKAEIDVYELYEGGHTVYRSELQAGKEYSHMFLK